MLVEVGRDRDRRVTEPLGDDLEVRDVLEHAVHAVAEKAANADARIVEALAAGLDGSNRR
jgi:hypothetical protein